MTVEIPILEYHDVGDSSADVKSFHSPYVLAREKFYLQMEWLRLNDYRTLTLDALFSPGPPGKAIVLTFDDGHYSNYEHAYPVLKKFNFIATFFVASRFIGTPGYLTADQILEMQEYGMRFESHTLTHPFLLSLNRQEMSFEIHQPRIEIKNITKREVNHFSIPYGFYNKDLLDCAREAGYQSVLTENFGFYQPNKDPFKILPRFTIKAGISQQQFMDIAAGRKLRLLPRYCTELTIKTVKALLGYRNYLYLKSLILRTSPS